MGKRSPVCVLRDAPYQGLLSMTKHMTEPPSLRTALFITAPAQNQRQLTATPDAIKSTIRTIMLRAGSKGRFSNPNLR